MQNELANSLLKRVSELRGYIPPKTRPGFPFREVLTLRAQNLVQQEVLTNQNETFREVYPLKPENLAMQEV